MANTTEMEKSVKKIDRQLDDLSNAVDNMYQNTYQSRIDSKKDMENIVSGIDNSIDSLLSKINGQNASDLSSLYTRIQNKNNSGSTFEEELSKLFDDSGQILDTINVDNIRKSIQAEDYQYDLICQYMTKLEDALEIKKDNVLSSDNFTKDCINVVPRKSSEEFLRTFSDKASLVKEKYDVENLADEIYYDVSKYGEYFLYLVPYKVAFDRLLKRKSSMRNSGMFINPIRYENAEIVSKDPESYNGECVFEAARFDGVINSDTTLAKELLDEIKDNDMKVNIFFDESGIIPEPIEELKNKYDALKKHKSVTESYFMEWVNPVKEDVGDGIKLGVNMSMIASDGLIDKDRKSGTEVKSDINGAVCHKIPRDQIFPIYMSETCIGYIYIQIANNYVENMVLNGYTYNSLTNNTKMMANEFDKENDALVGYIASLISQKIDAKFINGNVDLKKEIYAVLRYNDKFNATCGINNIGITFIPAEDIRHIYFKLDPDTHRGISDLKKAVVPAMVYCMLYLNDAIGRVSRANDKRVYYVKQNVEQNVSRTLLNVVNQLKKGNMGIRQLENMNTVFNVIGRYNDHIIPVSQSGDPPVTMEVMSGQSIETPTDLMDRMEDQAVSSTDVPLEFVQSVNQVDYATRFTMSNSKFLRKIYKRQSIYQKYLTDIFRRLYNYEYNENDQTMKVVLPAPAFLAMTNAQQLLNNVKDYANGIVDILEPDAEDEVKHKFINLYCRDQLGTYLDFSKIDDMLNAAKLEVKLKTNDDLGASMAGGEDEEGGF